METKRNPRSLIRVQRLVLLGLGPDWRRPNWQRRSGHDLGLYPELRGGGGGSAPEHSSASSCVTRQEKCQIAAGCSSRTNECQIQRF